MEPNKCLPCREICECVTLTSPDESVIVSKTDCTWSFRINPEAIPVITPTVDGSETKINVGVGLSKSGIGTIVSPYVLTNTGVLSVNGQTGNVTVPAADGSETKVTAGTGIQVQGAGTTGNPYIITSTITQQPAPDGTETKVTAGTSISISGNGSIATPYVINNTGVTSVNGNTGAVTIPTYDGSETKLQAGTNITITGTGTLASPYIITATSSTSGCATNILPYTGAPCCKTLDTALVFAEGLVAFNDTENCARKVTLRDVATVSTSFSTNFDILSETTGDSRASMQVISKQNIFIKIRGYMTWAVATTVSTTFTQCFTLSVGQVGGEAVMPNGQNREWFVWGYESTTGNAYPFVVRVVAGTLVFSIKGLPNYTYPSTNKNFYINLEPVIIETTY